jgi:hypothetical protein
MLQSKIDNELANSFKYHDINNSPKLLNFNLKLNQLNLMISMTKTPTEMNMWYLKNETINPNFSSDLKSLCELKVFSIDFNLIIDFEHEINFKMSLFQLLLIDARQIYGHDYQLLAASHNKIILDKQTGQIVNNSVLLDKS